MRRTRIPAAGLVIVAAATLAACSSDGDHSLLPISLADEDTGSTVEAEIGQRIEVTLHTIGPGSYESPSSSKPVLDFLGEHNPSPQTPAGPTQVYVFLAQAGGTVTVTIPHSVRPEAFSMTVVTH